MEIIAIIAANILFLALVTFTLRLDRRITHAEERSRHEISRLTERLFNVNRSVQSLQSSFEALGPAAQAKVDERAAFAEKQFVEAIEEIMGYCAPKTPETEAAK